MGWLANRREKQAQRVADIVKANLATSLPAGTSTVAVQSQPAEPTADTGSGGGAQAVPLPRPMATFGSVLSPGTPLNPAPLDPPNPQTGRSAPRAWQAPVAWNLDLTVRRTPWQVLKALADQVDVIGRCIEIRTAEITGLDWDFGLSDHAIGQIMADQGVGHAKAAQIGRELYGHEIDRLKEFFEQPSPGYTFAEWIVELLWNHYVLDAVAVYPECTLAGEVTGLTIIDGSTIKPLLDNRGMRPRPPAPAYQQILWGFPRGEWVETDPDMVDGEFYPDGTRGARLSDQLAYFVRNRRTWDPYGFSTVERCIPAAALYLGRQKWLNSEYSDGATPNTWMKTDSDYDPTQLAAYERIINDFLSGNTTERHRIKLLPKGFEPDPMPATDERYKPEYDEMVIKQVASKFGVMPTQLGVIPRTGLAGRGQQEGEQDQAETMSKKPTEEWLVDVINHLCRRFLGSVRQVTATFNGGDNAQNALLEAQAGQLLVASGRVTLNDLRAKNGDPLYDMPEADEPMIITPQGPVFLRGTLEQQLNPPPPPPAVHMLPPGPAPQPATDKSGSDGKGAEGGEPAEEDGKPDETAKQAEVAAWRRYTAKGARSRPFHWAHHSPEEVEAIVKVGDADPKAHSRPGPGGHREAEIVDHYLPLLEQAVRMGMDPQDLVERYLAIHHPELSKDVVGAPGDKAAIEAWLTDLLVDPVRLRQLIDQIHTDGYLAGAKTGVDQLNNAGAAIVQSDLTDAVASIDWDTWTPGDPEIASLLASDASGNGLAELLARTDTTIQGITNTTLDRLANILAVGVANGDSPQTIGQAVDGMLGDPARSYMIAVTETNRAMTLGTLDQYRANGVQGFDWVNANPCPFCSGFVEDNPHPLGDDTPPAHPHCRCAISPVLILPNGDEVDDPGSTADTGE